ncbi:hypothetical protein [Pasteurella sp. PK-2025]|uniref:hypothetical protein n=1 Tax=unclassified Pasteurella TaxID=2621516 RepID=UPI003C7073E8
MSSLIPKDIKQEILSLPWFVNAGKHHLINSEITYVSDKKNVTRLISSIDWENISLEASNDMYAHLYKKNLHRELDIWEEIVTEARQFISHELLPIIPEIEGIDINYINDDVSWNIMHFILERHFKKQLPRHYSFFTRVFDIYKSGYLVCGLQGQYPEGNLLVY